MKGLREQAKEEAKELSEMYNMVYLTFLVDELEKAKNRKLKNEGL